jgi:hypothetical protein
LSSQAEDNKNNQLATIIEDLNSHNDDTISKNQPSFKQDGHFSMMEFAMMNYKQCKDK